MKDIKELKKRLKNDIEFKKLFLNKKDIKELVKVAYENGYDVSEEDLEKDEELSEDALEAVAGGKKEDISVNKIDIYS